MLEITGHTVEKLEDPFGLLSGDRYEFFLNIEVPEDDELFTEKGLLLKVLYVADEQGARIPQSYFLERGTERYIDLDLEEDEEQLVISYCQQHLPHE